MAPSDQAEIKTRSEKEVRHPPPGSGSTSGEASALPCAPGKLVLSPCTSRVASALPPHPQDGRCPPLVVAGVPSQAGCGSLSSWRWPFVGLQGWGTIVATPSTAHLCKGLELRMTFTFLNGKKVKKSHDT